LEAQLRRRALVETALLQFGPRIDAHASVLNFVRDAVGKTDGAHPLPNLDQMRT
jgi:hypothetical protein